MNIDVYWIWICVCKCFSLLLSRRDPPSPSRDLCAQWCLAVWHWRKTIRAFQQEKWDIGCMCLHHPPMDIHGLFLVNFDCSNPWTAYQKRILYMIRYMIYRIYIYILYNSGLHHDHGWLDHACAFRPIPCAMCSHPVPVLLIAFCISLWQLTRGFLRQEPGKQAWGSLLWSLWFFGLLWGHCGTVKQLYNVIQYT